ncbi:MAG TPA: hypothetical protein VKZ76_05350 [Edaphocola sp.]|nr:hypothetical protein [Edaphocola sp.]
MEAKNRFSKIIPNLIAIVAFLLIAAVFNAPALKGDRVAPHDTVSWLYMSKEARDYYDEHGKSPRWTNSMFSGMPTAAIHEPSNANWYGNIGSALLMQPKSGLVNPIGFLFVCMLGAFVLLKSLKTDTVVAGIGAVAYGLSTYFPILITAGHLTKVVDLAYLPAVIGSLIYIFDNKRLLGSVLFVIFLSFYISAGHWQIIYYSLFLFAALGIAFLVIAIRKGNLKDFFMNSAIAIVLAVVASMSNYTGIVGSSGYVAQSMRGGGSELTINKSHELLETKGGLSKDYAFSWSNGIGETFCAIIPNLYGGASSSDIGAGSNYGEALSSLGVPYNQVEQMTSSAPTYFGPQPFLSGPIYFGAIVCFLAILALFIIKDARKWALVAVALLMIIISWGKNFSAFNYWMFDNFPMFNKFRSPNMALSITGISVAALAFWGLQDYIKRVAEEREQLLKWLKSAVLTTLGLVVVLIIYSQVMMDHKGASDAQLEQSFGEHAGKLLNALKADRAAMALKDGIRSLIFIAIAFAGLWALTKERINSLIAMVVIGLACTIDLWGVGKRYLNENHYYDEFSIEQKFFTPSAAVAQVQKDPGHFRVLDLSINTFNDAKTSYFVKTIGGYHPAKLQRYQDLIETHISNKWNAAVLNMLNTKYIISQGQGGAPTAFPNPDALGNAWFVQNIKFAQSADEIIQAMEAPSITAVPNDSVPQGFQPAVEAIVAHDYQSKVGNVSYNVEQAQITLQDYSAPYLKYESNNPAEGFAVFSEIYYPENWTAYIDGNPAEIIPVNYVLRGLKVPAGKHTIEFKYEDKKMDKAENVNLIGSIAVTLVIAAAGALSFRRSKGQA